MITPPFTRAEFELASYRLTLDENKRQVRDRPRASGLGGCSREMGYYMADLDPDHPIAGGSNGASLEPPRPGGRLTAEAGRYIEDLIVDVIQVLPPSPPRRPEGLRVVRRQVELPSDAKVSGHPDGELRRVGSRNRKLADGLVWGFESKFMGWFPYGKIARQGLFEAEPVYASQVLLYGHYLGWDAVMAVVLAQDGRAVNRLQSKALNEGRDAGRDLSEKSHLIPVDLRPYYITHLPQLLERADEIAALRDRPEQIAREYSGSALFPCDWCDWQRRCNRDGNGTVNVMPNPWGPIT